MPRVTTPQPTGRANARLRQTAMDMIRSLALVLAAVAVILIITHRPQPDAVKPVNVTPLLTVARAQAGYPVLVATEAEYVPTSVRWEPTEQTDKVPVWHVGYVTPDTQYVSIDQTASTAPGFIADSTIKGIAGDAVTIDGTAWQKYESTGETGTRRSLVLVGPKGTTVVSGTIDWPALQSVAAGLSATA